MIVDQKDPLFLNVPDAHGSEHGGEYGGERLCMCVPLPAISRDMCYVAGRVNALSLYTSD